MWGLILWCVVRLPPHARATTTLPVQLRYNVPIEMLYTVVPIFMVAVFFYYTARDEAALVDTSRSADVTISVVAKQWSWDFNYVDPDVYETGVHADLDGKPGAERDQMPGAVPARSTSASSSCSTPATSSTASGCRPS